MVFVFTPEKVERVSCPYCYDGIIIFVPNVKKFKCDVCDKEVKIK